MKSLIRFASVILLIFGTACSRANQPDNESLDAASTGRYGHGSSTNENNYEPVYTDFTKTLAVQYIRIDNHGDVEFAELEAYDANNINIAPKKPVAVSNPMWGDGTLGNDGKSEDTGANTVVMMRDPESNWWEVDLNREIPITHIVIYMRDNERSEGYRPLNGANLILMNKARQKIVSCQMEVQQTDNKITIPVDMRYFHKQAIRAEFGIRSDSPGNIFASDNGLLRMHVPDSNALANGSVTCSDLEDRTIKTITLTRGKKEYLIPLSGCGYYTITASGVYDGNLSVTKKTSAAVIGKELDKQTRMKSIFGIQGSGRLFLELGTGWSWTGINTHHVRQTASGYEWVPPTSSNIQAGKFKLSPELNNVILFNWLPEFMQSVPESKRGNCPTSPPKDYNEFPSYIKWVTSAIPDYVKYVAPVAEPSWSFKGSPEELVKYHNVIAKTIRQVRPDIRIIGPMMSPGNSTSIESIKTLDKLGMFANLEGISINPYIVDWPKPIGSRMPEADFIEFIDEVINYFASTARPSYPVYMTEFGYYSPTHVNELDKARYSCRAAILLATRPTIKMANFFCLSGGGGFSYLNADGTPRPVYPAMANVFRWLSDCSAGTVEKLAPNLYSAAFKKGSATGIALWDTKSDSSVHIPVSTVKNARDIMGRNIQIVNSRISTSPSPVFLEFCDDSLLSCFSASPAEKLNGIAGESFSIGNLKNVIMPAKFVVDGSKIKADLNAEPGEYRILRKFKGLWQLVLIEISANR